MWFEFFFKLKFEVILLSFIIAWNKATGQSHAARGLFRLRLAMTDKRERSMTDKGVIVCNFFCGYWLVYEIGRLAK